MSENLDSLIENDGYDSKSGKGFKKIFKNFSFLTLGKISGDFFTFILFVVLSRKFGQEGVGQYSFAVGLTGFFSVCADFGLYSFTIKEISRHKNSFQSYFQRIYSLRLIQFIVLLTLLLVIIPFLTFSTETKLIIAIIGIYQITYSFIDGLSAVFIAHEYMGTSAIIEASTRIITSLIAISIALLGGNIIVSLIIFPIFSVVQLLIVKKLLMKKFGKVKTLFSFNSLIGTFKQALPFGTSDFLSQLYERIDIVLIGFLLGESAAGLYNVGYRIVFFLVFIPKFASITLFPIVSRLFHDSFFEFQKMFDKSLSMIMIIGLPISAGLWLIAPQFIELIFGPKFIESSVVLKILSGLFLLNCLGNIMGTFLMASDQQTARAKIIWLITCVSILLNLILILLFKINGAATAIIISSFLLVMLFSLKLKSVVGVPDIKSKFLISFLGVLSFSIPFSIINLSIFIIIPVSILIYIGIIMMFKDVRDNELRMVLDLIRKR